MGAMVDAADAEVLLKICATNQPSVWVGCSAYTNTTFPCNNSDIGAICDSNGRVLQLYGLLF